MVRFAILLAWGVFCASPLAEAAVIHVAHDASGANDGSSWTDAYTDLVDALTAATAGDEIWVKAGTYKPTPGSDREASFPLKSDVRLLGGFAGVESTFSERDRETNATTLSGDIDPAGHMDSFHVVTADATDGAALDGFTITGGRANGAAPHDSGGGLYTTGALAASNCVFEGNFAMNGGGLYAAGALTVSNCLFKGNTAMYGGGIHSSGDATASRCVFTDNTAIFSGGGMYTTGDPTVTDCTFSGCTAISGGGMHTTGDPAVSNCTFNGNSATSGGGIDAAGAPAVVNCTFSGNVASSGGGMSIRSGEPLVNHCTFIGNAARGAGGGIMNSGALSLHNTILADNTDEDFINDETVNSSHNLLEHAIGFVPDPTDMIGNRPDLGLGPLLDNGGPTRTHALDSSSVAIDAGGVSDAPPLDQRGQPRDARPDIGAYEFQAERPEVQTTEPTAITMDGAIAGGVVLSDGGAPVTDRGVCWSLSPAPAVNDACTRDGEGGGVFTSTITGLNESDVYYVRAYAINGEGEAYGNTFTFRTESPAVSFIEAGRTESEDAERITITVRLSAASSREVVAPFTMSGTATEGEDYTITGSPVVFRPGAVSAELTLTIINDRRVESNETVIVTMDEPINAKRGAIDVFTAAVVDNSISVIEGRVFLDGAPLPGIRVNATSTGLNMALDARTDSLGRYVIEEPPRVLDEEIPEKGYVVEIPSADYPYQAYNLAASRDLAEPVGSWREGVDFHLETGVDIFGTVAHRGEPVAGAPVKAWSRSSPGEKRGEAESGEDGVYRIVDLPAAKDYIVAAFSDHHKVRFHENGDDDEHATEVDATHEDGREIHFALEKGAVITGVVYLQDASTPGANVRNIRNIRVNAWSDSAKSGCNSVADARGRYEIIGLDETVDDYVISIHHPGRRPAFYSHHGTVDARDNADGVAPSASVSRDLVLEKGFIVSGIVRCGPAPVPDAVVKIRTGGLENAAANARAASDGWLNVTASDHGGAYEIGDLAPCVYTVSVFSSAHVSPESRMVVIIDRDETLDVDLQRVERSINGVVFNLQPGEEARITAWSASADFSKNTLVKRAPGIDAAGPVAYAVTGLPPAPDYVVELVSEVYPRQVYNGKIWIEEGSRIDLTGEYAGSVDFTLGDRGVAIEGEILFPSDADPGEAAAVEVSLKSERYGDGVQVEYSGGGPVPFRIEALPEVPVEEYIVWVLSGRYKDTPCTPVVEEITGEAELSALEIHGELSGLAESQPNYSTSGIPANYRQSREADLPLSIRFECVLTEGAFITGKILDHKGDPAKDAWVHAWSESARSTAYARSDASGVYKLEGLDALDDYIVQVMFGGSGALYYRDPLLPAHEDFTATRDLSLAARVDVGMGNVADIDIMLEEIVSIGGRVTEPNCAGLQGVWVNAASEASGRGAGSYTDESGWYAIDGLSASDVYTVSAHPAREMTPLVRNHVVAGAVVDFTISLAGGPSLEGVITGANGIDPAPNVRVELWLEDNGSGAPGKLRTVSDDGGKYEFSSLPESDQYTLAAWPPEDSGLAFHEEPISVSSGTSREDIALSTGGVIIGNVDMKTGGDPGEGIAVFVYSETSRFQAGAVTDANGDYSIPNVPGGETCQVTIASPGFLFEPRVRAAAPPWDGVDFTLIDSGVIRGVVKDAATGNLLPNARVEASPSSPGESGQSDVPDVPDVRTAHTGLDGAYTLRAPAAGVADSSGGVYTVSVFAGGYPPMTRESSAVEADQEQHLDFNLARGEENRLSGVAAYWVGEPVPGTLDVLVEAYDDDGVYIARTLARGDGSRAWEFTDLAPEKQYQLKFTLFDGDLELLTQWAGESRQGDCDLGEEAPASAKSHSTETEVCFMFRRPSTPFTTSTPSTRSESAEIGLIHSDSHGETGAVSSNPFITVNWEEPPGASIMGYYHVFNQDPHFVITKRNALQGSPTASRKAASEKLTGDDAQYFFHIASVNDRGRIEHRGVQGFRIDTTPPLNLSVIMPENPTTPNITLTLGASGAEEVYISNVGYGRRGRWEPISRTKAWRLSPGEGEKSIYTLFRDRAGNTSRFSTTARLNPTPLIRHDLNYTIPENTTRDKVVGSVARVVAPGEYTYSIVSGDENEAFDIDPNAGDIRVKDPCRLDFETAPKFVLGILVSEGEAPLEAAEATIHILDVPDEPVIEPQTFSVDENSAAGAAVGAASANGPCGLRFEIVASDGSDAFQIGEGDGRITVKDPCRLDYEIARVHHLTVRASFDTPDGVETNSGEMRIEINDVENEPEMNDRTFSVDENSEAGSAVGTMSALGPCVMRFDIIAGNENDAFHIDKDDGRITVKNPCQLDFETTRVHALTVRASFEAPDGVKSDTARATIEINDLENELTADAAQAFAVYVDAGTGALVGNIETSGPCGLTHRIVQGDAGGAFTMDDEGVITVQASSLLEGAVADGSAFTIQVLDPLTGDAVEIEAIIHVIPLMGDWAWRNPLPAGAALLGAWCDDAGILYAAGEAGTILRYDGVEWTDASPGGPEALHDVAGRTLDGGGAALFAVGEAGVVLHHDGVRWSRMENVAAPDLHGVWAAPDGPDLFVVGEAGTILHHDGENWRAIEGLTDQALYGIWGQSDVNLVVVGARGTILRRDGARWSATKAGVRVNLRAAWGVGSDLFVVGDSGTILHYDGVHWKTMASGVSENLKSVFGFSATDVFAAGEYGVLLRYDGAAWRRMDSGGTRWLNALSGGPGPDLFAVGGDGEVLRFDGASWSTLSRGERYDFNGIGAVSDSDIYVAGGGYDYTTFSDYTAILHHDGTGWRAMALDAPGALYGITGDGASGAFAVGWGGVILRCDGSVWSRMDSGVGENLFGVCAGPGASMFAVGDKGNILHYDGAVWTEMDGGVDGAIYDVWANDGSDVFVAGEKGMILHFDGADWSAMESPAVDALYGVWGAPGSRVFAVGSGGALLHMDARGSTSGQWRLTTAEPGVRFMDVWGSNGSDVFAVGDDGVVFHYDGAAWSRIESRTDRHLTGVWVSPDYGVYIVGESGVVLEMERQKGK